MSSGHRPGSNYETQGGDKWVVEGELEVTGKQTVDKLSFNTETTQELTEVGEAKFNDGDRTLDIKLSESVTANLPTEQLVPRCVNKTGSQIDNGTIVYISGAQGNRPTIVPADASTYATSSKTIGVATEDIANNAEGFVTRAGLVRDLDTSAYAEGTCVYLSTTAGEFTDTAPSPADGNHTILVGMVIRQHATQGILCVKIMSAKEWFGDLDNGNYSYFESKGFLIGKGEGRFVEDLQFSSSTGKVPASNAPSFETLTTNTKEYAFSVNDFLYLEANEPPHGSDFTDTNASWHCHVVNKTANSSGSSQYVKIEITMAYADNEGTFSELTFTGECEIPDGTSALTSKICPVNSGTVDMSTIDLGGQIKPTVKRISATGGTEYADSVFITQIGLHIYQDQVGSRTVSSKL